MPFLRIINMKILASCLFFFEDFIIGKNLDVLLFFFIYGHIIYNDLLTKLVNSPFNKFI